jgi:hypothetical protein
VDSEREEGLVRQQTFISVVQLIFYEITTVIKEPPIKIQGRALHVY